MLKRQVCGNKFVARLPPTFSRRASEQKKVALEAKWEMIWPSQGIVPFCEVESRLKYGLTVEDPKWPSLVSAIWTTFNSREGSECHWWSICSQSNMMLTGGRQASHHQHNTPGNQPPQASGKPCWWLIEDTGNGLNGLMEHFAHKIKGRWGHPTRQEMPRRLKDSILWSYPFAWETSKHNWCSRRPQVKRRNTDQHYRNGMNLWAFSGSKCWSESMPCFLMR